MTTSRLLTIPDAARHARVTERTVQRWIASGRLATYRSEMGRFKIHVDADELEALTRPRLSSQAS